MMNFDISTLFMSNLEHHLSWDHSRVFPELFVSEIYRSACILLFFLIQLPIVTYHFLIQLPIVRYHNVFGYLWFDGARRP